MRELDSIKFGLQELAKNNRDIAAAAEKLKHLVIQQQNERDLAIKLAKIQGKLEALSQPQKTIAPSSKRNQTD